MTKTETFLEYKSLLFSVAYNMLGVVADAEDIVMVTDGGGTSLSVNGRTIHALRKPLAGKENVARFV